MGNTTSTVNWNEINPNLTGKLWWDWYDRGFTNEQTKNWIDNGVKVDEFEFATYLRSKGCEAKQDLNLDEWRSKWKENDRIDFLSSVVVGNQLTYQEFNQLKSY